MEEEKKLTRNSKYCCVFKCHNNTATSIDPRTNKTIRMHTFPNPKASAENLELCKRWIINLRSPNVNITNVKSKRVCSAHFENIAYNNPEDISKCQLRPQAVPTIIDCPNPPPRLTPKRPPPKDRSLLPTAPKNVRKSKDISVSSIAGEIQNDLSCDSPLLKVEAANSESRVFSDDDASCNLELGMKEDIGDCAEVHKGFPIRDEIEESGDIEKESHIKDELEECDNIHNEFEAETQNDASEPMSPNTSLPKKSFNEEVNVTFPSVFIPNLQNPKPLNLLTQKSLRELIVPMLNTVSVDAVPARTRETACIMENNVLFTSLHGRLLKSQSELGEVKAELIKVKSELTEVKSENHQLKKQYDRMVMRLDKQLDVELSLQRQLEELRKELKS